MVLIAALLMEVPYGAYVNDVFRIHSRGAARGIGVSRYSAAGAGAC